MKTWHKMIKALLAAVLAVVLAAPALAQTAAGPGPDIKTVPALAPLLNTGTKFFYLGAYGGMNGWFVVKDNQVQIVYATPDSKTVIFGAMFDETGNNVSTRQIQDMVATNKEAAGIMNDLNRAAASGGTPMAGATSAMPLAQPQPTAAAPATNAQPAAALSPGERLLRDMQQAAGVLVGNARAPLMYMVIDPHCPHCQKTWREMRGAVLDGSVQIKLVPIGEAGSDSERAAAVLLRAPDPFNTWDKYVAGDPAPLVGNADEVALRAVRANQAMVVSWNIKSTPYISYRAPSGRVMIAEGEPENVAALLKGLTGRD